MEQTLAGGSHHCMEQTLAGGSHHCVEQTLAGGSHHCMEQTLALVNCFSSEEKTERIGPSGVE
jgi:hypothetical protein